MTDIKALLAIYFLAEAQALDEGDLGFLEAPILTGVTVDLLLHQTSIGLV